MDNEKTSDDVASIAGRILGGGKYSDDEVLTLAASALTQTPDKDGIKGLPVAGYKKTQSQEAVDLVNGFKADEERLLRKLDVLAKNAGGSVREEIRARLAGETPNNGPTADPRWLAKGRTALEEAFMFINRAVFQPARVALPEDDTADGRFHHYNGKEELNIVADDAKAE